MLGRHKHRVSKMNIRAGKRTSSATLMFQAACLLGLAASTLVSALEPCRTEECRNLAARIEANMDSSVDPCQDFFQHACGNFIKNHPTPRDMATYSTLTESYIQLQEKLYQLLEEPENPADGKSLNAIKRQYQLCTNNAVVESAGLTTLLNIVRQNGGWPMIVPDVFPYRKSVQEVHDEYDRLTGNGPLYTVLVYSRDVDTTDNAITFDQPLEYPRKKFNVSDPANARKFVKYIADVGSEFAKAAGADIPRERLDKDAQDVFDFMTKLQALREPEEYRKRGPNMTIADAQEAITNGSNYPFDLLVALQTLYRNVLGVTITKDEVINVRELQYMQGLIKLLGQTSPVVTLNYLNFHFVENYLPITTNAMRKLVADVYGTGPRNRTVQCASLPNVDIALGRLYAKRYVSKSQNPGVEAVLNGLKAQVKVQIERTPFIDATTRVGALAKVDKLIAFLGNSDLFDSDEAVDQYYAKYKTGDDLVENMVNYHEVEYRKRLEDLRETIDYEALKHSVIMSPIAFGAFYTARLNRLALPAATYQPPLFSLNYPALSNYAGLGQIFGEVLGDSFVYLGLMVNGDGGFEPWMTQAATTEFEKRDQCFIDQYSSYEIKELADAGIYYNTSEISYKPALARYHFALKTAYMAHRATVKPRAYRTQLVNHIEGLPLLTTQVDRQFFLNYANTYCQSVNPPKLLEKYNDEDESHQPTGRIKVNSAVSNLPEFSQVYGCPIGSPMNPAKKCSTLD